MNSITFIMKPLHSCNAECIYCSAYKENEQKECMSTELVEILFQKILDCYREHGYPRNTFFIWHGGEPLLMPDSFYYRVIELQQEMLIGDGITVRNSIQTNLLLLNHSKAKMLKELLKIHEGSYSNIGTSYDPIKGIRRLRNQDYNKVWNEKRQLLREYGLSYGIVYVVHKRTMTMISEVFESFLSLYQQEGAICRFNPLYAEGRAKLKDVETYHLEPSDWGCFLIEFYKRWEKLEDRPLFNPINEYFDYHYKGQFNLCCESAGRCSTDHLGVDTDGQVYQCGRGIDDGTAVLGSIHNLSLHDIVNSGSRTAFVNRKIYLRAYICSNCKWWGYCHGGCPIDSLVSYSDLWHKTKWCEGRRMFFNEIFGEPRQEELYSIQDVSQFMLISNKM